MFMALVIHSEFSHTVELTSYSSFQGAYRFIIFVVDAVAIVISE